jgi:Cof subfamily protein (haloacid dehalogenase superfamily)
VLRPNPALEGRLARISLVLMDVDGTLVTAQKKSFDNVIKQLWKLKHLNITFSIATGRTIAGVKSVTDRLREVSRRLPPMITYNGAVILAGHDTSVSMTYPIESTVFAALVRTCRDQRVSILAYACRLNMEFAPRETVYGEGAAVPAIEFNGMEVRPVSDLLSIDDEFVSVLIEMPNGTDPMPLAHELGQCFEGRLHVTTSGGRYVEINHPSGTKLHAMTELARIRALRVDQIMAIGDNRNDLGMIRGAGVGVAVANAPSDVRAVARFCCTLPSAEGVVEALRLLNRSVRTARVRHWAQTTA